MLTLGLPAIVLHVLGFLFRFDEFPGIRSGRRCGLGSPVTWIRRFEDLADRLRKEEKMTPDSARWTHAP